MCSAIDQGFSFTLRNEKGRWLSWGRGSKGQSSIEAAFALPVLMVLMLMLLQPGILLYDRIVMESAAAEGCRLLATTTEENAVSNEDYIRRRLSAVPQVDIFHVHGSACTWDIGLSGSDTSERVSVSIATEVKPLPLLDIALSLFGMTNSDGNLTIHVQEEMPTQPSWVRLSEEGANPRGWVRS